ncbi:MAG: MFS transporter [Methanomassiliicoccales archaeon]
MRLETRALILTSLAHFANDGNMLLYPVLITYYELIPGANIVFLGSVAIIYNVISGVLSTPVGIFADSHNMDTVILALGIFLNGISVLFFVLPFIEHSSMIPSVIVGSLLLGLGQSIYHPVGGTMVTESYERERAPKALGINGALGSLGRAVIPTAIVSAMTALGYINGLTVIAVYLLLSSAVIYFGLRDFRRRRTQEGSSKTTTFTMQKGFSVLYVVMIVIFFRSMFTTATLTFVPQFLTGLLRSRAVMSYVITVGFAFSVGGQPFFGLMQARFGGRKSVALTTILSGVSFLAFLYFSRYIIADFVLYSIYAFFTYSVFPVLLGYVNNIVPPAFSTRANSIVWGIGQTVGGAAGIGVMTGLIAFLPLMTVMWLMLLFSLASMLTLPFIPSDRNIQK